MRQDTGKTIEKNDEKVVDHENQMTEFRKQMNQVIDKLKKDNVRGLEEQ